MDVKRKMMKKIVLAGIVMFFAFAANAQTFKKGETVEISRDFAENGSWAKADIVDVDLENKQYSLRTADKKLYRIPFSKEDNWIRRPLRPLTTSMKEKDELVSFIPSADLLKQKIKEEFESDFSEYDSVIISYDKIEALASYKNTDNDLGSLNGNVYPFTVDFTLRLVNKNDDGTNRKINWQFKRKYVLYQNARGKCTLSLADKDENYLSHI